MIMANTDDVQIKVTKCNNISADNFSENLQENSLTGSITNSVTNRINNNDDARTNTASSEASPLIRYFDFDESNYSYVLGYN